MKIFLMNLFTNITVFDMYNYSTRRLLKLKLFQDVHGPIWKSWGRRTMARFPELPIISRCHSYDIRYWFDLKVAACIPMKSFYLKF